MNRNTVNILIGGEAGQGLATLGETLTRALVRAGYSVVVTQSYESRIRGGHNTFAIRVSTNEIQAPREMFDILVALHSETLELHRGELSSGSTVIVDADLASEDSGFIRVPFKELGSVRFENVTALGVVTAVLGLDQRIVAGVLEDFFAKRGREQIAANLDALEKGFRWIWGREKDLSRLQAPDNRVPGLMMNGNEAIALGAMSAGVKFCAFYPMTPATSIAINLAGNAEAMGIIVEQAEDEIAAINMAIGASFAGAPSMVVTSGGGFALMTEGVSLAAMTETPVVIVVAQRPGPATGLPTRTEQADLEFVLHAGHGEFPRAVFAPGSVEECFHLARKAFETAEQFRGPVFLLTDQFLADSYRSVERFKLDELPPVNSCAGSVVMTRRYRHYAVTDSGVSPRLFPGLSEQCGAPYSSDLLVCADSDEHTESGHITEDLSLRKTMVEKRLRKLEGMKTKIVPPDMQGDPDPDVMLICWGSTKGSVLEAAAELRARGLSVATVHLSQMWPLAPEQLVQVLSSAKLVASVEGNATGQMARLIRRETGFAIEKRILRYDGLPITPEAILGEFRYV